MPSIFLFDKYLLALRYHMNPQYWIFIYFVRILNLIYVSVISIFLPMSYTVYDIFSYVLGYIPTQRRKCHFPSLLDNGKVSLYSRHSGIYKDKADQKQSEVGTSPVSQFGIKFFMVSRYQKTQSR